MAEESQVSPLAPPEIYERSDGELAIAKPNNPHHQETSKLIVYILTAILSLILIFLIFGSIFFKANSPKAKLRSVTISNLLVNGTANATSLSMTMVAQITVENKNFGRFVLENNKANFVYENVSLGDGDIFGGRVRARKTGVFNVTVQARANEYLAKNNTNFRNDIRLSLVKLSSYARLRGKVHVTKLIKRSKTAVLSCTMSLNLKTQAIQDLICR